MAEACTALRLNARRNTPALLHRAASKHASMGGSWLEYFVLFFSTKRNRFEIARAY